MAAVRALAAGHTAWPPELTGHLLRARRRHRGGDVGSLSVREREVLRAVAAGLTRRQIASRLTIVESTVDSCLRVPPGNVENVAEQAFQVTRVARDAGVTR